MPAIDYTALHARHTRLVRDYIARAQAGGQQVFLEESPSRPLVIRWRRTAKDERHFQGETAYALLREAAKLLRDYPGAGINLLNALLFVLPKQAIGPAEAA